VTFSRAHLVTLVQGFNAAKYGAESPCFRHFGKSAVLPIYLNAHFEAERPDELVKKVAQNVAQLIFCQN
jgi:hypothetical protein